jgi:hypothetical protein
MVEIRFNGKQILIANIEELGMSLDLSYQEPQFEQFEFWPSCVCYGPRMSIRKGSWLDRFDQAPIFELWASVPNGPSILMLRNGSQAWLMYLRFNGDAGYVTQGDPTQTGKTCYILSNGQADRYPLSWCIDLEQCYRAIAYFCAYEGARPKWIAWHQPQFEESWQTDWTAFVDYVVRAIERGKASKVISRQIASKWVHWSGTVNMLHLDGPYTSGFGLTMVDVRRLLINGDTLVGQDLFVRVDNERQKRELRKFTIGDAIDFHSQIGPESDVFEALEIVFYPSEKQALLELHLRGAELVTKSE